MAPRVWDQLKSLTASALIRALKRDGWIEEDHRGARRGFGKRTEDGAKPRRVVIHYHPNKTYGKRLIRGLIGSIGWTEEDLKRLKLIKK